MKEMPGSDSGAMGGKGSTTGMMKAMRTQMNGMMSAGPEQMKAMLPTHRQMAANRMARLMQMHSDMMKHRKM